MSAAGSPLDATIVGAGPAGVSAALWARTFDLDVRWLDRTGVVGGILERVENTVLNYPGLPVEDGTALAASLRRHLGETTLDDPEPLDVDRAVRESSERWSIELSEGSSFASKTLVLATGTSYRTLGVPGESEGMGECVSQSTARDAEHYAGRTVAIVGGGDAGFEGALQLAASGCRVHMLLRSETFRARPQFVEPARRHASIFIHPIPSIVERIDPLPNRNGCLVRVDTRGEQRILEVACLFVRIGVDPVYPDLDPAPETDEEGYIRVDRRRETSVDGLYAAGDVTDTPLPAVVTAVGGGATAIHAAGDRLGLV